jgi:hypothetical protein
MMLRIIKKCCRWLSRKLNIIAYLTAENPAPASFGVGRGDAEGE